MLETARGYLWIGLSNSYHSYNLFQLSVSFVFVKNAAGLTCISNDTIHILCDYLKMERHEYTHELFPEHSFNTFFHQPKTEFSASFEKVSPKIEPILVR